MAAALVGAGVSAPPAEAHSTAPVRQQARPGPPTSGDSLFPDVGNRGYDVSHYNIALRYDETRRSIRATTTVSARAEYPLSSFALDLEGLTVDRVRVDGSSAAWARSGHKLLITPKRSLLGSFTVVIAYHGKPVTHVDPDGAADGWIPTKDGATVLSEPVGAMTWFPNNNTPRDKATFTTRITVPNRLEVAGNGTLSRRRQGSRTTWTWRQRQPMATYLAMISIDDYRVYRSSMRLVSGKKLSLWSFVEVGLGSYAAQRALVPKAIRFEERRFGPYPFSSAGIVVVDTGAGYALETQTRPVFDATSDVSESTVVHELAHQWYGDSLTPCDWGDIWLNEGFASYTESLWLAAHGGPSTKAQFRQAYATAPASLWSPAPADLKDPADLFSDPVYLRGGMTLEVLRERIGSRSFSIVLKRWAARHAGSCVSTGQFVALAEEVSHRDLDQLFDDWLYVAKKPVGYVPDPTILSRAGAPRPVRPWR
ncbi:MAG: M1 family metallopeptidase [Propionibacteriaceae bacterium]